MLKSLYLFTALLILTGVVSCQQEPATPLQIVEELNAVDSFKTINGDTAFQVTYELWFQQPVDHSNPDLGTFPQKVIYSHKGFDKPVVVVMEGYALYGTGQSELCRLLDANQITIEHRFFDESRPKDSIPWSNLTVANAAADQHNVIQAFKPWYNEKWISTGIKRGTDDHFSPKFVSKGCGCRCALCCPFEFQCYRRACAIVSRYSWNSIVQKENP